MTPERWEQVGQIFQAAAALQPQQRSVFLNQACGADENLRREVESLLELEGQAGDFLDAGAMEDAARVIAEETPTSLVGKQLGRYEVLELVEGGNMGEVYRARDAALKRQVAVKVLPLSFSQNADRLRRFKQEPLAVSSLNHPNIVTIHEIGEVDHLHFMVSEFVEGETLRQQMTRGPLQLAKALEVAIQIASALEAAHRVGIVHRDIKPENVMVRPDGLVKVLDFGLAKLTEPQAVQVNERHSTAAVLETRPGMIMGTTTYMSPEQARGAAVDTRTDLWSLGVVLYEMIAGHPPFEGGTPGDLIAAILKTEPRSLTHYVSEASELEHLARKVLEKDREARYQTAGDLLEDLKEIKQELDFQAKLERSSQPEASNQARAETGSVQDGFPTVHDKAVPTEPDTPARKTSSAEYLISEIKQHRARMLTALGLFLSLSLGVGYAIYRFRGRTKPAIAHFQSMKIVRVTNQGNVGLAAISPDGKYITYAVNEGDKFSLWTKDLVTDGQTQIVPPVAAWLGPNTFTHDGGYVYYIRNDAQSPQGTLYQMPFLGGPSKKILNNIECPISLSPDGKQFSFYREYVEANENELLVANADGTNERHLLRPKLPEFISPRPAGWSPDGKMLAVGYGSQVGGDHMVLGIVSIADGTLQLIRRAHWSDIGSIVWFNDGSGLVLQAQEQFFGKVQIWQVWYPGGETRRITNDLSSYDGNLSLTADDKTLIALQGELVSNIWIAQDRETNNAHMIASGKSVQAGLGGLTWTPDGRVVFGNNIEDKKAVWIVNADGSDPKPLTDGTTSDHLPEITADGRYLVVISTRSGSDHLWRMDMDGSNLKQLTDGLNGIGMSCITPDGRWVVYSPFSGVGGGIWKVSIDGGNPIKIIEKSTAGYPQVSPDGKLLACHFGGDPTKIIVTTFDNGSPVKTVDLPETSFSPFRWSHDSRALIYIDTRQGVSNLWSQPLDGSAPRQITNFKSDLIYQFASSRDGKQFALARGSGTSDAVMISESR